MARPSIPQLRNPAVEKQARQSDDRTWYLFSIRTQFIHDRSLFRFGHGAKPDTTLKPGLYPEVVKIEQRARKDGNLLQIPWRLFMTEGIQTFDRN